MDTLTKLGILADAAKYDAACTSSGMDRAPQAGKIGSTTAAGLCHSFTPDGRCVTLLKVLLSNACSYDCAYCVNRRQASIPRATFTPRELAELTVDFYKRNYIEGLFLSSGVLGTPDATTERMIACLRILRHELRFNGYVHAKVIPGTSTELVDALGRLADRLSVNLEQAYNSEGREIAKTLSKNIILYQIDEHWKEHLREMDDLKQSVQNASYEQKDPIVVYKLESYNLFASMLETLNQDVLSFLFKAFVPLQDRPQQPQRAVRPQTDMSRYQTRHSDLSTNGEQKANTPVKVDKKVGRNDPCPCGSGLKYKNCHGKGLV